MNTVIRAISRAILPAFLVLLALPGMGFGQDTTPPTITALSVTPSAIDTNAGPAAVAVNFTLNDTGTGVSYFETGFADPSGFVAQRNFKTFPPGSNAVIDSLSFTFPQFSTPGTWTIAYIFVMDGNGNTQFLDSSGLAAAGFTASLQVTSAVDTIAPDITTFTFTPTSINTTAAAQTVTVNFTATDDLAGVTSVYAGFVSPTGVTTIGTRVSAPADFTAGTTVTNSLTINFPKSSEPGTWKVSFINVVDGAGNTLFLDTAAVTSRFSGFVNLVVTSTPDTTPPNLTTISLTPSTISSNGGNVTVNFAATDNASGVNTFQIAFLSPSGGQTVSGATSFPAATSVSSSSAGPVFPVVANFPPGTEEGTWTQASVFIADAAGNTRLISQPISLVVNPPGADTTPPIIIPTINPMPNGAGWNNTTPVTVAWTLADPESGITSTLNCGVTTIASATTGTPVTCSATNGAGLSSSATVVIAIDTAAPVTTNVTGTPNPVPATSPLTITATVIDSGGSNLDSAEYKIDGGAFQDLAATDGTFDSSTENVSVTLPINDPVLIAGGSHTFCVRGSDVAGNVGAVQCVTVSIAAHTPPPQPGVFIGLKNSDDQGTSFDLQVDVFRGPVSDNVIVASGLTRCIQGVTTNPNSAKEVAVALGPVTGINPGDLLSFRISTRIGTNPDGTKCAGHNSANGLRLYYDSTSRTSLLTAEINGDPPANFFLHTGASDFFDTTTPTGTTAKTKDSTSVNFNGGNLFKVIGTWSRTQP